MLDDIIRYVRWVQKTHLLKYLLWIFIGYHSFFFETVYFELCSVPKNHMTTRRRSETQYTANYDYAVSCLANKIHGRILVYCNRISRELVRFSTNSEVFHQVQQIKTNSWFLVKSVARTWTWWKLGIDLCRWDLLQIGYRNAMYVSHDCKCFHSVSKFASKYKLLNSFFFHLTW